MRSVMGSQNTCTIILLQPQLPRTITAGVTGDTVGGVVVVVEVTITIEQQAISITPGEET